jgi:hypothetical protein
VPSAAVGGDYSRVEGRPGALRTTATQNLICAHRRKTIEMPVDLSALFAIFTPLLIKI